MNSLTLLQPLALALLALILSGTGLPLNMNKWLSLLALLAPWYALASAHTKPMWTNKRLQLLALILSELPLASAFSLAAYPVCLASCSSACGLTPVGAGLTALTGPLGAGACVAACVAGCACYDADTTVEVLNGTKVKMGTLGRNDRVKTLSPEGDTLFTLVHGVTMIDGEFAFANITTAHGSLLVTESHPVFVSYSDGEVHRQRQRAGDIAVGDMLLTEYRGRELATPATHVGSVMHSGKIMLFTDACSVLADGVLAGTGCSTDLETRADGLDHKTMFASETALIGVDSDRGTELDLQGLDTKAAQVAHTDMAV